MKTCLRLTAVMALVLLATAPDAAPPRIPHQGIVLDSAGHPLTGPVALQFDLFESAGSTTSLWSETHPSVALVDGVYSVELGDTTPLNALLLDGAERWLEVRVNGEVLAPRQRLLSVPYALRAQALDGAAVPSLESLEGVPCRVGTPSVGTTHFVFSGGGQSPVSLECTPSNSWTLSVTVVKTPATFPVVGSVQVSSTSPLGILCPGTCSANFPGGTPVTLNASGSPGWIFDGWTGPCTPNGSNCVATMDAAKAVTATFHCQRLSLCDAT